MSDRKKKLIHLIYGIYVAVFVISAALHLAFSCYAIYSGGGGFSREAVAAQFSKITFPIYACIALILGGIILSIVLPVDKKNVSLFGKKKNAGKDYRIMQEAFSNRIEIKKCRRKIRTKILKERHDRQIWKRICAAICAVTAIPVLIYICNPKHYDKTNITESIIPAVALVVTWCVTALIFCLVWSIINRESLHRECDLFKETTSRRRRYCRRKRRKVIPVAESKPSPTIWWIRGGILAVAVTFIIIGVFNGGMGDVLAKAIRICTECIGLG